VAQSGSQFHPYVFVDTSEQRPSSIAVAGWVANQMKYITLPQFSTSESLPQVQDIVREHFRANGGRCHLYGDITNFRFVFSPTESILLDTGGNVVRNERGKFWPRSITMPVETD
jgi:hypothetical protein